MNAPARSARWTIAAIALATGMLIAGCGIKPATSSPPARTPVAAAGGPTLATSASGSSGTDWAVVKMGGSAQDALDNFWELFARPAGTTTWKLATPAGVASNGGLVMAATGPASLVTGFLPTQKLTFSPLATTSDGGSNWSQSALLDPGFGAVPYALAAGSHGQLLALTGTGNVEASANAGLTWRTITTQRALAASPAARACGVQALTAAAWTPSGSPVIAARCAQPGVAGIFTLSAAGWRRTGPTLAASVSHDAVDVIGLATNGQQTTAVLAAKTTAGTTIVACWSADGGTTWRASPGLGAKSAAGASVSIWADGAVGLVLPGTAAASTGATIGSQTSAWRTFPLLPARTATLAAGPNDQPQALAVSGTALTTWQLAVGSNRWTPTQTIRVPVPIGSSG